jgi:hypothetical protein
MKKAITIIITAIIIIAVIVIFILAYNDDSNKLKRYLKKQGYTCNSSICSKTEKDIFYQVDYKEGIYSYESQKEIISIYKDKTIVDLSKQSSSTICEFQKDGVKDLTTFTEEDTSNNCLIYLEKVNRLVDDFKKILVKSGTDITKLSK